MTKEELLTIFGVIKKMSRMKKDVQDFVRNKSNSFEDRLEIFTNTPSTLQEHDSWILTLDEFEHAHGEINWFDDFYLSRHQDIDLTDYVRNKDDHAGTAEWSDEKFRAFQEAILDKGVHSFTLDW